MTEELDVASVIQAQAYATKSRYSELSIDLEDLIQEGWVWILDHADKVAEYRKHEAPALAAFRLGQDVWKVMDRYARKEKAAKGGYEPADESFYGETVISAVLPSVLANEPAPVQSTEERTAKVNDPAEGATWLATYADVKNAWTKADLTDQQRRLLVSYYRDDMTQVQIADAIGVQQQAVAKQLQRAKRKMIDRLGGPEPADCPFNCECHDSKVRRRPGQ